MEKNDEFFFGMDFGFHNDTAKKILFTGPGIKEQFKKAELTHYSGDLPTMRMFNTIELREHPALNTKQWRQVRFPRSKKKRIRKKWSKNQNNFAMVDVPIALMITAPECITHSGKSRMADSIRKVKELIDQNKIISLQPSFIGGKMVSADITPDSFKPC